MSRGTSFTLLVRDVLAKTPPLSYKDSNELYWNLYERNKNKFPFGFIQWPEILHRMVEKALIERDGKAYNSQENISD